MKKRGWQLLIIPDGESSIRQFRLPRNVVLVTIGVVILIVLYAMVETALFWTVAKKASQVEPLKQKVRELETSSGGLSQMGRELAKLRTFQNQLKRAITSGAVDSLKASPLPKVDISKYQSSEEGEGEEDNSSNAKSAVLATPSLLSGFATPADIPTQTPAKGYITRNYIPFGPRSSTAHHGIDIAARPGTPIVAAADGLVIFADWTFDYGNLIVLEHASGYTSFYGHNQTLFVKSGDHVLQGQPIAMLGNSGKSSAPHLHFEVWNNGTPIDPLSLFKSSP